MKISFLGNFSVDYSSESQHAKTLESMGHTVNKLQEAEASAEDILAKASSSNLFIWIHTHGWATKGHITMDTVLKELKKLNIPTITYHLDLWLGLDRQKDLREDPFYSMIEHFFATDKLMADWFNENTKVKGHYLPAGVFENETIMLDKDAKEVPEIVFVGSRGYHPEWPYRPQLISWLEDTYKDNFGHYSGEEGSMGLKRGLHLNQLLADTKIVIGDSLCINFVYPHYWSDRVYETIGRGGFLIMPYIQGLDDYFEDGKHLVFYEFGDFKDLKAKIDFYLQNNEAREYIRHQGFELVKSRDTYTDRWQAIFEELGLEADTDKR